MFPGLFCTSSGVHYRACIHMSIVLTLTLSRLTKETLTAMQKLVKKEGESAKTSVRGVRRDIMDSLKKLASEDEQKRMEKQVRLPVSSQLFSYG